MEWYIACVIIVLCLLSIYRSYRTRKPKLNSSTFEEADLQEFYDQLKLKSKSSIPYRLRYEGTARQKDRAFKLYGCDMIKGIVPKNTVLVGYNDLDTLVPNGDMDKLRNLYNYYLTGQIDFLLIDSWK
jgi:hypothetical protein